MSINMIIRELLSEHERIYAEKGSHHRLWQMQYNAYDLFGALNGWRSGRNIRPFGPEDIGKRSASGSWVQTTYVFDHCAFFRRDGKCAAILAEPYEQHRNGRTVIEQAQALAAELGVACHVPPHPRCSIWNPGSTQSIVFTAVGHQMRWLPEQINGIGCQGPTLKRWMRRIKLTAGDPENDLIISMERDDRLPDTFAGREEFREYLKSQWPEIDDGAVNSVWQRYQHDYRMEMQS
jgi:hypothetical protein